MEKWFIGVVDHELGRVEGSRHTAKAVGQVAPVTQNGGRAGSFDFNSWKVTNLKGPNGRAIAKLVERERRECNVLN